MPAAPSPAELARRDAVALVTGPDGAYPLREEGVRHFGTAQRYRCWQRGPNSRVCLTLPELFASVTGAKRGWTFLVFEGERYTYGEVLDDAAALGRELAAAYGVRPGDRVAVAARNYPEWVVAFVAAAGAGACVVALNSWWRGDELRYGLEDSGARVLFADEERLASARPFLSELGVRPVAIRCAPQGVPRIADLVDRGRRRAPAPAAAVTPDDKALIMYTSGTTSKPKGVLSLHRNLMAALNSIGMGAAVARATAEAAAARAGRPPPPAAAQGATLACVPLFHATGCHAVFLGSFCTARKMVLMPKWNAARALEHIQRERVTQFTGVPTMSYELMDHPDFAKYDTSSLVSVGGGGAAFKPSHAGDVKRKFKNATGRNGWGMTETNAVNTGNDGDNYIKYPTSCGRAQANVDVCVLDEGGKILPPESVGELAIRGPVVMECYWNKPEKTQEAFHVDGEGRLWMRTGDVGRMNEEGFIFVMDRIKDLIIRGGENISCAEVEAAVYEHPAVAEAAVFGLPDERLGETVAAAVVWKKGSPPPPDRELIAHVAERLAKFKVPTHVFAWADELPRGATGKIQKRDIRDRAAALQRSKL